MHSTKWKGIGNQTLEKYVASHRNAYTQLRVAAAHVAYHLQNERSHLQHMLNNIE